MAQMDTGWQRQDTVILNLPLKKGCTQKHASTEWGCQPVPWHQNISYCLSCCASAAVPTDFSIFHRPSCWARTALPCNGVHVAAARVLLPELHRHAAAMIQMRPSFTRSRGMLGNSDGSKELPSGNLPSPSALHRRIQARTCCCRKCCRTQRS
jgi:hypothetical protein